MSNLSIINEQLQGMSADIRAMEQSFAMQEHARLLHRQSPDRIPALVAEGAILADHYGMDYVITNNQSEGFSLAARDAAGAKHCVVCIPKKTHGRPCRQLASA